jgi:hypothetical protein
MFACHRRIRYVLRLALLLGVVGMLPGCGESVVRPFIQDEFEIEQVVHSSWVLSQCDYAAYRIKPKPLSYFLQQGAWSWQVLPLPDDIENGMGLLSRTYGGVLKCIASNKVLRDSIYAMATGRQEGYYRFYQSDVLAFYLPETHTLVVGYVEI